MSKINDLLEMLDAKHLQCVEADELIERMFAEGRLQESYIDQFAQHVDEYEDLLEQASRELEALDMKLRNWK